jgi:hypothetical protein
MRLYRASLNLETCGDLLVGKPVFEQPQDLLLSRGEVKLLDHGKPG